MVKKQNKNKLFFTKNWRVVIVKKQNKNKLYKLVNDKLFKIVDGKLLYTKTKAWVLPNKRWALALTYNNDEDFSSIRNNKALILVLVKDKDKKVFIVVIKKKALILAKDKEIVYTGWRKILNSLLWLVGEINEFLCYTMVMIVILTYRHMEWVATMMA